MSTRRPTRKDVALKAGVAPSTVSLVLQEKGDALRIPAVTQDRVREAARSLGYYPNFHIESVMKGRSGVLGVYLRWDQWSRSDGYWNQMLYAVQCAVASIDGRLLVHNARFDCPTEEAFARQAGGIVDGVIIFNSGNDPIVGRILETGLPAVEIGDAYSELPFVGSDGVSGVRMAIDHLKERGYKHPAFLGHLTNYEANAFSRVDEFVRHGSQVFGKSLEDRTVFCQYSPEGIPRLLALDPRPDCVVCASDEFAYELRRHCVQAGIRVPEEMAITGFDALPALGSTQVMTSVKTPMMELCELGVAKLLAIIEGKPYERETLLPVSLRIGETT
jgi:DNA-binding LacI/PurR family transcriptional regulator